jgi:hypothetical protein
MSIDLASWIFPFFFLIVTFFILAAGSASINQPVEENISCIFILHYINTGFTLFQKKFMQEYIIIVWGDTIFENLKSN